MQALGGVKDVVKGIREGVQLEHTSGLSFTELLVKLAVAGTIAADTNILMVQTVVNEQDIVSGFCLLICEEASDDAKNFENKIRSLRDTKLYRGYKVTLKFEVKSISPVVLPEQYKSLVRLTWYPANYRSSKGLPLMKIDK